MILTRRMSHYMITYYLPSSLFVVVSWTSFLIPSEDIQGRMALLVTLFLVLVSWWCIMIAFNKHVLKNKVYNTVKIMFFQFKIGKYFQYNNNQLTQSRWFKRNAIVGYLLYIFCLRCIIWIRNHTPTGIAYIENLDCFLK